MAHDLRKAELIATLDRARSRLAANALAVREDLNPLTGVQRSFRQHGLAWLGGATLFGLVLSKLPARTKKVIVDRKGAKVSDSRNAATAGLLIGTLKLAFDLGKPFLSGWLARRAEGFAAQYDASEPPAARR
jgi:hypothetical protein